MKPSIELLTSICQTEETINPSRTEYGINQISHPPCPTHNVDKAPCGNCGRQHERCPALGSTCNNCGRKNHWASTCRQRSSMQHTVNEITRAPMNDARDEVFIILMNKYKYVLKAKIDTGAQSNVLPISVYHQLHNPLPLSPPTHILLSYGNTPIDVKGTTILNCTYLDKPYNITFHVTDARYPTILGLPTCRKMSVIYLNCSVGVSPIMTHDKPLTIRIPKDIYSTRFNGLGRFPGTLHIIIDPSINPVIHAARRVPLHILDEVASELKQMCEQGVITKVTEPTPWVSSLTYARKKSGKIRLCLDPKDLNKAINRPHYTSRTLDDINHLLCGLKVFSKLDARSGYWAVVLDESSSKLTTFNTHLGRYRFRRLPFGLNLSQDIFHHAPRPTRYNQHS